MRKLFFIILFVFSLICSVNAAKIHGNIYDFELSITKNTVLSIGPTNKQIYVARDGNYTFEVPPGQYQIIAKKKPDLIAKEEIIIESEGKYLLDLILFPDISEEEFILSETIEEKKETQFDLMKYFFIIGSIAVIIILLFVFFHKKKPNNEDELKQKVITILKKEGKRVTQKDLRRQLPYSEAKISLVVSELEKEKKIKKIKKGRGNILVLENG